MRLQDLKHLDAAMEAFTACVDVDMLLGTLFAHTRDLFHMEAAFVWLTVDGEQSRLHLTEGVPASVACSSPTYEDLCERRTHDRQTPPQTGLSRRSGRSSSGTRQDDRYGGGRFTTLPTLEPHRGSDVSPIGSICREHSRTVAIPSYA